MAAEAVEITWKQDYTVWIVTSVAIVLLTLIMARIVITSKWWRVIYVSAWMLLIALVATFLFGEDQRPQFGNIGFSWVFWLGLVAGWLLFTLLYGSALSSVQAYTTLYWNLKQIVIDEAALYGAGMLILISLFSDPVSWYQKPLN